MAAKVDPADVTIEFYRASGPGGQHRNKAETGVRLRHGPTGIIVTATERRSRAQNLAAAWARLEERVAAKLAPRKRRIPTKPSRAAKRRRLDAKKRVGKKKALRRSPRETD